MNRAEIYAAEIRQRFLALAGGMNEATRRRWAAAEAQTLGYRGLSLVSRATGISRPTIRRGLRELEQGLPLSADRIRRPGAGRKSLLVRQPGLPAALDHLIGGSRQTLLLHGVPQVPRELLASLQRLGYRLSLPSLLQLLDARGFHVQIQGGRHPTADAELSQRWAYVSARVQQFRRCQQPVLLISAHSTAPPSAESAAQVPPARRSQAARRPRSADAASAQKSTYGVFQAALGALIPQILRAHRGTVQDLLVLVQPPRSREPAQGWRRMLRKLAQDLGLPVQLILLPRGTYRARGERASLHCRIAEESTDSTGLTIRLRMLGEAQAPDPAAALLYAAAYPAGLVEHSARGRQAAQWTLSAQPRSGRRTPTTTP